MNLDVVLDTVIETVRSYRLAVTPDGEAVTSDSLLFGGEGLLDSIGLVSVVIEVEQKLSDLAGREISLMDDRALSRSRSPFRTPRALAEYAHGQLQGTAESDG